MIDIKIQGDQYWRFENRKIDGDFPHKISDDFPGVPNNLDAGNFCTICKFKKNLRKANKSS